MSDTPKSAPSPEATSAPTLTHLDAQGRAHMVDVGAKPISQREAVAVGRVEMHPDTLQAALTGGAHKGDVLGVARLAGIMGAKRTGELIPLCHPLPLTHVSVRFAPQTIDEGPEAQRGRLWIEASARCVGRTGVEMEAMAAVTTAALTIYDMLKAVDRTMVLGPTYLHSKTGGRAPFIRPDDATPRQSLSWQ